MADEPFRKNGSGDGGSSGIGAALGAAGSRVLTCGRNESALARRGAEFCVADLATQAGRERLVEWVAKQTEVLDLLFSNAGVQRETTIGPRMSESPSSSRDLTE